MDTAKWIEIYIKTNVGSAITKIVLEYVWFSQKGLYLKVLGHLEVIGFSTKKNYTHTQMDCWLQSDGLSVYNFFYGVTQGYS